MRKALAPPKLFEYVLPGGWLLLAGRTDEDNDRLSLSIAEPNDLWFHARGVPGSHVVLRVPEGEEPDRETVRRAAAAAAYHSKSRAGGVVPVSMTRARYVTKPRGVPQGTVEIRNEKVVRVRPVRPEGRPLRAATGADRHP